MLLAVTVHHLLLLQHLVLIVHELLLLFVAHECHVDAALNAAAMMHHCHVIFIGFIRVIHWLLLLVGIFNFYCCCVLDHHLLNVGLDLGSKKFGQTIIKVVFNSEVLRKNIGIVTFKHLNVLLSPISNIDCDR